MQEIAQLNHILLESQIVQRLISPISNQQALSINSSTEGALGNQQLASPAVSVRGVISPRYPPRAVRLPPRWTSEHNRKLTIIFVRVLPKI